VSISTFVVAGSWRTCLTGTTMADVRLELAREEAADADHGNKSAHEITASLFLMRGLELEEQQ
jgi:hypothetical protein